MTPDPLESPLRWQVKSDSRAGVSFLVDLGANHGFGWCGCEQHQFRVQPMLDKTPPDPAARRCKHIEAARDALAEVTIQALLKDNRHHDGT